MAHTSWWSEITSHFESQCVRHGTKLHPRLQCQWLALHVALYRAQLQHIFLFGDLGKTGYNSLQIKAETKTPKYGLYALFAYTYSRTYDNGLTDGLGSVVSAPYFPLPNWQNLDWSLSQINLDNSFTGSVIYDLPFGRGKQFGSNWNAVTNAILGNFQVTLIQRISFGISRPLDRQH